MRTLLLAQALVIALLAASSARAAESYDSCKYFVTSLPATLTGQGVWCLKADLVTAIVTGNAITIAAHNVTLDCNGFKIGGLAAGPGTAAYGIGTESRNNTTIRNCNIRGFYGGIYDHDGNGHLIEDNALEGNTFAGIYLTGTASTVRRNRVTDTGLSSFEHTPRAIRVANDTDVIDNIVSGVDTSCQEDCNGTSYGIQTTESAGTVTGNRVRGVSGRNAYPARLISIEASGRVVVADNILQGNGAYSIGITCEDGDGLARDNQLLGVDVAVLNCTSVDNYIDLE